MSDGESAAAVLRSPAKINLNLRITGLREDGYHLLQSLFCPISLYDEVSISPSKGTTQVRFQTPNGTPLEFKNDSVSRSLKVLKEAKINIPDVDISIVKTIPSGGGLGGGSSNAATVLKFLHDRFAPVRDESTTGSDVQLKELGLKIGADVPFFLRKGPAMVEGIGDVIHPVKLEPFTVLVITPPFSVLTKDAYSWFDRGSELTRRGTDATKAMIAGSIKLRDVVSFMKNDLEKPVETRHPEIGILKKALRQWGALGSLMSGSGSSVYGLYNSLSEAKTALEKLQQNFPSTYAFFVCETLT